MITHATSFRVSYADTDRMGFVYYGNYAVYFEVARVEWLRSLGFCYKDMEDGGVSLPVLEYSVKFFKPAFYDQKLTVKTTLKSLKGVRIIFLFETFNDSDELINSAETTLVFMDTSSKKPCMPPDDLLKVIAT